MLLSCINNDHRAYGVFDETIMSRDGWRADRISIKWGGRPWVCHTVDAMVFYLFAVHRMIDGAGWTISFVPLGRRLSYGGNVFAKQLVAMQVVEQMISGGIIDATICFELRGKCGDRKRTEEYRRIQGILRSIYEPLIHSPEGHFLNTAVFPM